MNTVYRSRVQPYRIRIMLLLLARPHVLNGFRGIKETSSILQIPMKRNNSTSQHSAQRRAEP